MPPRFVYWTIIAGGLPTAFRAAEREELLPTFQRLREKHPDAQMKYFAQGKLWDSPDQAREARLAARDGEGGPKREFRGRDWRPGGEHRDPRQKFADAKRDRNQRWRKEKYEKKNGPPRDKPHGDPVGRQGERPDWRSKSGPKPEWRNRPAGPKGWDSERRPPREKPHGDPVTRERSDRPNGPKNWGGDRPASPRRFDREGGAKRFDRDGGAKRPFRPREDREPREEWTPREKPHGDKLAERPRGPKGFRPDRPSGPQGPKSFRPDRPAGPKGGGFRPRGEGGGGGFKPRSEGGGFKPRGTGGGRPFKPRGGGGPKRGR